MTGLDEWQGGVGRNWATQWRRTDRSFAALTKRLIARIAELPGNRVLDIGCGAGELSLAIAGARPGVRVTGVDVSDDLVEAAQARAHAGSLANVEFLVEDAARWSDPQSPPNLVVSRHGVMFFDDPPAAFAHLATTVRPGAQLVFSCFRAASENPWASEIAGLIPQASVTTPPDRFAPGPFAFADPAHVEAVLAAGGWQGIAFEPVDFTYVAGEGADPVADALAFFCHIGPAAAALRALATGDRPGIDGRREIEERLVELLERRREGSRVSFPAAAWIVTARRGAD
ncbi:class I SAM-dependent methyltransferase [Novosphingobium lentum]|uniref:class I SAM-dependent methyltransferase n=1 Tax=Novosphingobium lentum TaxID=145287 RepID=UPI00082EC959|nr:class I SAM-dependent methyltransferase [Novosphingobium lentum]